MPSKFNRALLAIYVRPQWPRAVLLAALLFAGIALQLANPQIARTFIDRAQAGEPVRELLWVALVFIGVVLIGQAATVAETYVADNLGWRTTNALRADLTRHVLHLDGSFHSQHGPGELIERIDGDVLAIAGFFSRFVVHVVGSVVFLIGVLVLLFLEDWRFGALLTFFAFVALAYMTRGGSFVGKRSRADRQAAGDLSGYLEERLGALPDIKANGADAHAIQGMHKRTAARFHTARATWVAGGMFYGVVSLIFVIGTGASLLLGAGLHRGGAITLGTVYLVFRYTGMMRLPLERLWRQMNSFQRASGGIARVTELLSAKSQVAEGKGVALPNGALPVEFSSVNFAYGDEPVLREVSFRIQAGETLGLLGRTGSGKTTISRLLFRLHDPASGVISLGEVDIREAHLDELRARIGLVTQDVQLFEGSLRDNVALFDLSVRDETLIQAFTELGLDDWLRDLPEGLDTRLGSGINGRGLSAGESQLVALARVFLKEPGLVVLDEASSRLDPATELLLERAMTRLLEDRTGIVIAHRLTTVERADQILILEDGRVAEFGPREQLAADLASRYSHLRRAGMQEVLV